MNSKTLFPNVKQNKNFIDYKVILITWSYSKLIKCFDKKAFLLIS